MKLMSWSWYWWVLAVVVVLVGIWGINAIMATPVVRLAKLRRQCKKQGLVYNEVTGKCDPKPTVPTA